MYRFIPILIGCASFILCYIFDQPLVKYFAPISLIGYGLVELKFFQKNI